MALAKPQPDQEVASIVELVLLFVKVKMANLYLIVLTNSNKSSRLN